MEITEMNTSIAAQAIPPTMAAEGTANRFLTIPQLSEIRPAFTKAALRDIAFKADDRKNSRGEVIKGNGSGPAGVWLKLGSKRLADLPRFDAWVESHRIGSAN